ncbi:protein lifeguard 1 [Octopus sinensis]|uniref:Protein lifeguard 1 n=1 Tax=Octopus sinensis TaxID=2607531 RepID=A0A6P7SFZ9_9MOLL|nr:protein lifeguard 1 [Octopus sinensis]XP_036359993.1 protein lifeguard 1 [Octopus sinensis]XP_036359994.1 protein lifeguard 1 [Octopus sinensis]
MYEPEAANNAYTGFNFEFSEKTIRMGFIRKVYGILMLQLMVTLGIIALFLYVTPVREYSNQNPWMWYLALVLTFVTLIMLACCPDIRRQFPTNFIVLCVFTVCEGFLLGAISSHYDQDAVLIAVGITALVSAALTLFAFQTKWDFTTMGGLLFVFLIVLFVFGILCAIIQNRYATLAYAALGALLFSFYLVFDTQMMIGGRHKYSISPEEYIFAALNLYLDIVQLFMFILTIVGNSQD